MKILSFGVGAIGTYVCGNLDLAGHEVVYLERELTKNSLIGKSLKITNPNGDRFISNPKIFNTLKNALNYSEYDLAILAIKAYDLPSVLSAIQPFKDIMPAILCLLNGIESESKIAAVLGSENVISGTVTTAVIKVAPGEILVEKPRGVGIGGNHPIVTKLIGALNEAGINTKHFADSRSMKWSKLLTNMVCNATSAIFDKSPAEIYANKNLFKIESAQLKEMLYVAKIKNIKINGLPGVPANLLALILEKLPSAIARPLLAKAVGSGRGGKMPSFHIDLYGGSEKSEVEYLNGAVVRAASKFNIKVPINRFLTESLLALASKEIPMENLDDLRKNLISMIS